MIVCVCHRVSDQTIARAAKSGMGFDDIQLELGVATQCGKCETCARAVWSECCRSHPMAHLQLDASGTPTSLPIPLQLSAA
jgi:bacterioferritin-associated ferredoxin